MKVVIQRVKKAKVSVNERVVNQIDAGYLILVGFTHDDSSADIDYLISKIINLRIFSDEFNKMNYNLKQVNGKVLSISQFTLYAQTKKGNRPSFIDSMSYDKALKLYEQFNNNLNKLVPTYSGVFGQDMQIEASLWGPVTIIIDSKCK